MSSRRRTERGGTAAAITVAVLWLVIPVLGMSGAWFVGLLLSIALMVLLAAWGTAHDGRPSLSLLAYPIVPWALLWVLSFSMARLYGQRYAGVAPDFTILGFHPSFAWIVLGYWVGGVLVLTGGFYLRRDRWLSAERWERFTQRIAELERLSARGARRQEEPDDGAD